MVKHNIGKKRKIVAEASVQGVTIKAVARDHSVWPSQIRRWRRIFMERDIEFLVDRASRLTLAPGPTALHPEILNELYEWFCNVREAGIAVGLRGIVTKYLQLLPEPVPYEAASDTIRQSVQFC